MFAAACSDSGSTSTATRSDSAGIEIVSSPGPDRPLAWTFERVVTIATDDERGAGVFTPNAATVRTDSAGRIYALDRPGNRIIMFGSDGKFERSLGRAGSGPGEMTFPIAIAVAADGTVSVFDVRKRKIVRIGADGTPLSELTLPASPGFFGGAFHNAGDDFYYDFRIGGRDDGPGTFGIFRATGDTGAVILESATEPTKPIQLKSCGMGFSGMPPLFSPYYRWDLRGEWLAIARDAAYDIRVSRAGRDVRRIRRAVPPQAATLELAAQSLGDGMRVGTEGGERVCDPREVAEQQGFAPVIPSIETIAIAPDGSIWVRRGGVPAENQPIDVFSGDGAYEGTLPGTTQFPAAFMPNGDIVVVESDENDVPRIAVYTIRKNS